MECLSQVCSLVPCLWDCSAKHAAYVADLEDNLNSLRTSMVELSNLNQDVKNRVRESEEQHMKRTNRVSGWLQRVEAVEKEANQILEKGTQELENKCVGSCCPKNCWSSYKLGKKVLKMLPEVTGLTEKGQFDVIADMLPAPPVVEQPMENTVVGFESKFEEVWQTVQDKDSTIIGLVGIGGAGKTTLLKQLNNEFLKTIQGFDMVIWIVVSKPTNLERIRDTIRSKLNISDHLWGNKSEDQRVSLIYNKLKDKKFVILLDDLWERIELSEMGIPQPCIENKSKVVLTTRSREVCRSMDAYKVIKVGCLPQDQALNLFCSKVGEDMLKSHPEIRELVKDVANECQGLPLALITIGRSMNGKLDAQSWKDAKTALQKYPSSFPGMEARVFSKLVFSYDSLPTPTLQKCFEYCSIFPEDHEIEKETLIRLWIAERLIDEYESVYDAHVQGRQIVESLMHACLLEVGESKENVKMHDVIRDMALWLACERGKKKNKFWVDVANGDIVMERLRNSEKISLWGRGIRFKSFARLSLCSNLVTLIIRNTKIEVLVGGIFACMKSLKVLDLLDNEHLAELPTEIDNLINLEYLNLMGTNLKRLPVEVEQLKKLRFLGLSYYTNTGKVISSLCYLLAFEQNIGYRWSDEVDDDKRSEMERETLEQLEGLEHIMDVCLVVYCASSVQILLGSPKLQRCTRQLSLSGCKNSYLPAPTVVDLSTSTLIEHLERLHLFNICDMLVLKLGTSSLHNLLHVSIDNCDRLQNVNYLVYIINLRTLSVVNCKSIEELIGEDDKVKHDHNVDTLLFSCVTSLKLFNLPKLRSICPKTALPFPCLEVMHVMHCPNLKKLPLDSNSAITMPPELKIFVEQLWWGNLQWESRATKDAFTSKAILIPPPPPLPVFTGGGLCRSTSL